MPSTRTALDAVRYFLYPASRYISDKTEEIDHRLKKIREQRAVTSRMVQDIDSPDLLRSLVISMQNGGRVKE